MICPHGGTRLAYPLLFATLALCFFFPFNKLLALSFLPRLAASSVVVGLPIIWAGFIFSNSFREEKRVNAAFGSNLLGVVVGGALEYCCNMWGLSSLYLIAIALYLLSYLIKGNKGFRMAQA